MKNFKHLQENVKSADRKPEIYTDPSGKKKVRMVATDREVVKTDEAKVDEISLSHLTKKIADSGGMKQVSKANKADKLKKDLEAMKQKLATEAMDPREYDYEGDMVKGQLRQICKANRTLMDMIGDNDNLPEWVQSKVTKATDYMNSVRAYLESEMDDEEDEDEMDDEDEMEAMMPMRMRMMRRMHSESVEEKTLTPAEKKKREEIAKAMERENPGMDMSKKMAIATAQAKKVAEEIDQIDEVLDTPKAMDSYRNKAKYSKERAANSAAAKMFRNKNGFHSTDTSQELDTMDKRTKGLKMADRAAARKYRQSLRKEETKPDAAEVMRKKQQMANISTSDKDKLAKIRAMLDKEKKK